MIYSTNNAVEAALKDIGLECDSALVRETAGTYKLRLEIPISSPDKVMTEIIHWIEQQQLYRMCKRDFENKTARVQADADRYNGLIATLKAILK